VLGRTPAVGLRRHAVKHAGKERVVDHPTHRALDSSRWDGSRQLAPRHSRQTARETVRTIDSSAAGAFETIIVVYHNKCYDGRV
jgi:hypothetical protein